MRRSDNREMVEACFSQLMRALGEEAGRTACEIITESLGGYDVYIPSRRTLEFEARNAAIRAAFDGRNYRELAIRYKTTTREIKRVLRGG